LWAANSDLDLLDTFLLFGDPAMRFPNYLASPTNLAATTAGFDQIDLTWTDNSDDESAFMIERSLNGADGWEQIAQVSADSTAYSDTGLNPDETWHYRVRAFRVEDGQYSAYSNVASDTTNTIFQFYLPIIVQ